MYEQLGSIRQLLVIFKHFVDNFKKYRLLDGKSNIVLYIACFEALLHERCRQCYCKSAKRECNNTVGNASAITLQCSQHRVQHYFASDNLFIIYFSKFTQRRCMISKAGILVVSSVK
jgi:hypothetical protein